LEKSRIKSFNKSFICLYKLVFILIVSTTLFSDSTCTAPPSNTIEYSKQLEFCDDLWSANYYRGEALLSDDLNASKLRALLDLSNNIEVFIKGSTSRKYTLQNNSSSLDLENYFESSSFLNTINVISVQYKDKYIIYKNKDEYKNEIHSINKFLLNSALDEYDNYNNYNKNNTERFNGICRSYFYINTISTTFIQDKIFLDKYQKYRIDINNSYDNYIRGISITPINNNIDITANVNNDIAIEINVSHQNKNEPLPLNIIAAISTDEFEKTLPVQNKSTTLKIGTISSITSIQNIFLFPKITDFSNNKIEALIENLINDEKDRMKELALSGQFGEEIKLEVNNQLSLNYNKELLRQKFNGSMEIVGSQRDLFNVIEDIINENHNYDSKSTNIIEFDIRISDDMKSLDLYNICYENDAELCTKIPKSKRYLYSNKKKSFRLDNSTGNSAISNEVWKDKRGKKKQFEEILKAYVQETEESIYNIQLKCNICPKDRINFIYNDKNNTLRTKRVNSKNSKITIPKGGLKRIEFYTNESYNSENIYAIIKSNDLLYEDLYSSHTIELDEIFKTYLKSKGYYQHNSNLLNDKEICFKPNDITIEIMAPYDNESEKTYDLKNFQITANNKKTDNDAIFNNNIVLQKYNNTSSVDLVVQRNKYEITINNTKNNNYEIKPNLMLRKQYNTNVFIQAKKDPANLFHFLLPGITNFKFLHTQKANKFRGLLKAFITIGAASYTYDEYNNYTNSEILYQDYSEQYENLNDATQSQYNDLNLSINSQYQIMSDHRDAYNIAIGVISGIYLFNIFQYKFN